LKRHCFLFSILLTTNCFGSDSSLAKWDFNKQVDPKDVVRTPLNASMTHMEVNASPMKAGHGVRIWRVLDAKGKLDDPVLLWAPKEDLSEVAPERALTLGSSVDITLQGRFDSSMQIQRIMLDVAVGGEAGKRSWVLRSSLTGERDLAEGKPETSVWDTSGKKENDGLRRVSVDLSSNPIFRDQAHKEVTFTLIFMAQGEKNESLVLDNLQVEGQVVADR